MGKVEENSSTSKASPSTNPTSSSPTYELPFPVFLPEEIQGDVFRRFTRRIVLRLNTYYRNKYFHYQDFLDSLNGPVFYPVLRNVLRDQGINVSLYDLLTCYYYIGEKGHLPVRHKKIQTMMGLSQQRLDEIIAQARDAGLIYRQSTPLHPDGTSYLISYRGKEFIEKIAKEFHRRVLAQDPL